MNAERVYEALAEKSDILHGYIVPEYEVCRLVSEGVSDMHCMSDAWLADELQMKYLGKNSGMQETKGE